jgi:hypothetical protein
MRCCISILLVHTACQSFISISPCCMSRLHEHLAWILYNMKVKTDIQTKRTKKLNFVFKYSSFIAFHRNFREFMLFCYLLFVEIPQNFSENRGSKFREVLRNFEKFRQISLKSVFREVGYKKFVGSPETDQVI